MMVRSRFLEEMKETKKDKSLRDNMRICSFQIKPTFAFKMDGGFEDEELSKALTQSIIDMICKVTVVMN